MAPLIEIFGIIFSAVIMLIIVQFIIGLLFAFNVVSPSNQFLMQVYNSINALLDPILRPIRRILPDTGAIDFSPLVLIIGLQILDTIIRSLA
ncbi:YggT family protein [Aurantiacibacter sediminis]|uniref:YggT family protein n=1 Tax=Aurantiacibacter sediminis TaxID=2793064 RepID=A0ABS0MZH3_9SPHN|nr:YggT family protein [Aurantiacibacter sediminis]MBH5321113.1 YggT family protein [Aurantiacibacter sediminis]